MKQSIQLLLLGSLVYAGSMQPMDTSKKVKNQKELINCSICFDSINSKSEKENTALSCGHLFHYSCINEWLEINNICPLCRKEQNIPNNPNEKINSSLFAALHVLDSLLYNDSEQRNTYSLNIIKMFLEYKSNGIKTLVEK